MKKFKITFITFLLGASISSLNAQLEVHVDSTVSISKRTISTSIPLAGQPPQYVNVGIRFIPSTETISSSLSYSSTKVMALVGFNSWFSIGTNSYRAAAVHTKRIYLEGTNIGPLITSDFSLKTNIRELAPTSEKILKLRPVTYDFVKTSNGEDVSKDPFYKNRTGFIAQEVAEIFPDLVVMDENKMHSLDYAGLIPYLTKALQEQSEVNKRQEEIIKKLQQQINDINKGVYMAEFVINEEEVLPAKATTATDNLLYQNAPNPFNISTTIKYQLADNTANAKICIYNLTGKQLQCHNLPTIKGENSIEVRASSLQAGMYLYSLIVDDKLASTKRMILTE